MGTRSSRLLVKRAIDIVGGAAGLVLLSPVTVWIAVAVAIQQGRPILFRQSRPGRGGRLFTMYKFRTMRPAREGEVWYLTDDQRITRLGHFLRATSLDELPELWNVVRGEMSLVGPLPLLPEYLETYSADERRRHEMRPGVTGWAVVNGRNSLQFKDRLGLDVWYVDHWSLGLDATILRRTILQVLRRENVSADNDRSLGFPLPGLSDDLTPTGGVGNHPRLG
jgi:sugar transferase EpsL